MPYNKQQNHCTDSICATFHIFNNWSVVTLTYFTNYKAIISHAGVHKLVDTVLVNNNIPTQALDEYKAQNSYPVEIDEDAIKKMGIKIYKKGVIDTNEGKLVRHSPRNLARAIYLWYRRQGKH